MKLFKYKFIAQKRETKLCLFVITAHRVSGSSPASNVWHLINDKVSYKT